MNNKYTFLVIGLIFGLAVGFFAFKGAAGLGAANVTPGNALDSQTLTNELNLIANPLVAIEQSTTATLAFPALNPTNPQSTTTAIGIGASLGDIVLVYPNGTTTGAVSYSGQVTTASATSATMTLFATAGTTGTSTPNSQTFTVTVLPFASFKAPVGL